MEPVFTDSAANNAEAKEGVSTATRTVEIHPAASPIQGSTKALTTMASAASHSHNKIKVLVAMFFGVLFGALGNICLSRGMRCVGESGYECAHDAILGAVTEPYIVAGVILLGTFLLLYLASLSWEDLSYVLPLTAGDYVLVTILAFLLLHEDVEPLRWAGSILVATGIALVARS